jgi:heme/copper-type cytochrome/quinol oxidase subunit 4
MGDQNEFFSLYGEGHNYAKRRQEGLRLFKASIQVTKAAWNLIGIVFVCVLTVIALWAVPRAHAGAQFIIQRFTH